ncbi:MAG: S-layer homology domain-containing protein, partial [Lysinibacillus sp.]
MSANAVVIKDVKKTYWAYSTIQKYVANGYVALDKGCFYPNRAITRGEMADILVKTLRLKQDATVQLNATDITPQHPHYGTLRKLVELGVLNNSKQLKPDGTLTRAQMAKIIALAFEIEVDNKNKTTFKDYKSTYWAKHYIESLADEKIIQGKSKTRFAPQDSVTRAQFVTLVSRAKSFATKVKKLEIGYDLLSKGYIDTKHTNHKMVEEVIKIVNKERAAKGLKTLQEDKYLNQLATVKLNDMLQRKYFEHESPYYGYPWEMANYFDYEFKSLGENLAKNLNTPTSVMKGWMASPKHKEN